MKDVPWEQALDTILAISGLGKSRIGNVITVMSLEKMKKEEADRLALAKIRKDETDRAELEKIKREQA